MHLCNRKTARTKTIVVVSHKQLCMNSLHGRNKVGFKAACLLQRCLNLLYGEIFTGKLKDGCRFKSYSC